MTVRDQLDKLVQELLEKGVLYDDARREFEKMFIARALQRSKGNVGDAADILGLHRNTARALEAGRLTEPEAGRWLDSLRHATPFVAGFTLYLVVVS